MNKFKGIDIVWGLKWQKKYEKLVMLARKIGDQLDLDSLGRLRYAKSEFNVFGSFTGD